MSINDRRAGFTLIEMLIVISILTFLISVLVLYNRTGERQLILLREQAKFISVVLRAKSLALNTFVENEPACGYGVVIEEQTYFIYKDLASNCHNSDHVYSGLAFDEKLDNEIHSLDSALKFYRLDIRDILFVPPNPQVYLDGGQSLEEAQIGLSSVDENLKVNILINNAGQISS